MTELERIDSIGRALGVVLVALLCLNVALGNYGFAAVNAFTIVILLWGMIL